MSTLVSGRRRSTLNPDAPLFIPAAFRQVEDFSPEWWKLITTSTWFHDYWLSQHQNADGSYDNGDNVADLLPDTFDIGTDEDFSHLEAQFEEFILSSESEQQHKVAPLLASNGVQKTGMEMDGRTRNLSLVNCLEERGAKFSRETTKYAEKAAKFVNPKCSPRRIQQPR